MAKANKAAAVKGGKAKAAPAAPAVPQAVVQPTANGATRGNWEGYNVCGLLRALGYAGYTVKQAGLLLPQLGLPATSASTLGCQVGAGRQYARGVAQPHHTGPITPLAGAALATVTQLVGPAANPHATTAPLPAPKGAAPAKAPAPAPAPAKATKGKKAAK